MGNHQQFPSSQKDAEKGTANETNEHSVSQVRMDSHQNSPKEAEKGSADEHETNEHSTSDNFDSKISKESNILASHSIAEKDEKDLESESEDEPCCDTPQDDTPPVSYNLKLICSTDDTKSRNTKIVIPHTPRTVLDVKLCVENEFSIPACCQCMTFESHKLRDQDSIEELRIREGDTLTVKYTSDAMVEDIREIIVALKKMKRFLQRKEVRLNLASCCVVDGAFSNEIDGEKVELLASTYFHPVSDEKCKANRLFFVSNNGLRTMYHIHKQLLKCEWKNCPIEMYSLEHAILRVLWNISAAFSIRNLLLQQPTLEAVMKSAVRVEIPVDAYIQNPRDTGHESYRLTCEMLYKAIGTLGNFAEIPECRVAIASRSDVLDQLLAILTCPTYKCIASLVAAAGLLCLTYSPETHQYLTTENVIEKFERACTTKSLFTDPKDKQLLKYFQCIFYAQLLHTSGSSKIPLHLKHKMYRPIRDFLETADFGCVHAQESKHGYVWSTVAPFVRLAYFPKKKPEWSFCSPDNSEEDNALLLKLEELCIEMGIFSLQNMLLSDQTRDVIIDESLVDYIVCLPWHLSPETEAHGRACDLKAFLSQKMQLQPPSLVNLTKAKLAATHCGLDTVLKANGLHDIMNIVVAS